MPTIAPINLRHDRTDAEDQAVAALAAEHGMTYCPTCLDGCNHGPAAEPGSCGHLGCWGPDGASDCAGAAFGRAAYRLA